MKRGFMGMVVVGILLMAFQVWPASMMVGCTPEPCDIHLSTIQEIPVEPIPPVEPPVVPPVEPPVVEPVEPGTLISRDFTTQAQIDEFHWVSSMVYPAGDPKAGRYDADLGGAVLPITPGYKMPSLRDDKTGVEAPDVGRVFVEFEIYIPQSFYAMPWPTMSWDSIKAFRIFNNSKRETTNRTTATFTYVSGTEEFWVRSLGDIDEPGLHPENLKLGWRPEADTWTKMRFVWDYDQAQFEISGPGLSRAISVQGLKPIDNVAPLLHSTSRNHGGTSGDAEGVFLAYRNVRMGVE